MAVNNLLALLKNKQIFAVVDQISLSLASFLTAFVLVKVAGVESFGVYSFLMVLCILVNGMFSSFLHGQMTLRISGSSERVQNSTFKSTFKLYLIISLFVVLVILTILFLTKVIGHNEFVAQYYVEIRLAMLYTFVLSLFDLFRRFLYVLNRQDLSLICTVCFAITLVCMLVWVFFKGEEKNAVAWVFGSLIISNIAAILLNQRSIFALLHGRSQPIGNSRLLFSRYFDQGRFGFLGMLVTWVQNQGITPFLMAVGGPSIVGYFNLARLMTVPVTVVNTGITSSALPKLRALYRQNHIKNVDKKITIYSTYNFVLAASYFVFLLVLHFIGVFERFIPDYKNIELFLLLWSLVCMAIIYRTWITQFFVVSMKFKFLLKMGAIAATFSYTLMVLGYLILNSYYIVPLCVLIGEALLTLLLIRSKRASINQLSQGREI